MAHRRILGKLLSIRNTPAINHRHTRSIYGTSRLDGWIDSIKGAFTGNKSSDNNANAPAPQEAAFTLDRFADEMGKARKLGALKKFVVGRSSEATFADAFEKQEEILRFLGKFDPNGQNLLPSQKQEAAKHCKCTIADIENTLAKFTWAKEVETKLQKLKDEGKPLPKSMEEVQKLMGSTPLDLARSNMAKSGTISRNAMCPCGSKKRYKRCCGQDK